METGFIKGYAEAQRVACSAALLSILLSGCVSQSPPPVVYPVIVPMYQQGQGQPSYQQQPYAYQQQPGAMQLAAGALPGTVRSIPQGVPGYPVSGPGLPSPFPNSINVPAGQPMANIPVQGLTLTRSGSQMTPEQHLHMAEALFAYSDGMVEPIVKELSEIMQPVLEASACGTPWTQEVIARGYERYESRAVVPFQHTPKHNTSECLDVHQVDNWRLMPPTRVAFRVIFKSRQTGETASRRFELSKFREGWRVVLMNEPF